MYIFLYINSVIIRDYINTFICSLLFKLSVIIPTDLTISNSNLNIQTIGLSIYLLSLLRIIQNYEFLDKINETIENNISYHICSINILKDIYMEMSVLQVTEW